MADFSTSIKSPKSINGLKSRFLASKPSCLSLDLFRMLSLSRVGEQAKFSPALPSKQANGGFLNIHQKPKINKWLEIKVSRIQTALPFARSFSHVFAGLESSVGGYSNTQNLDITPFLGFGGWVFNEKSRVRPPKWLKRGQIGEKLDFTPFFKVPETFDC
jgi:hypothetical protein